MGKLVMPDPKHHRTKHRMSRRKPHLEHRTCTGAKRVGAMTGTTNAPDIQTMQHPLLGTTSRHYKIISQEYNAMLYDFAIILNYHSTLL